MSWTLLTIPAPTLDLILSSYGLSQGILNLWFTGDRAIQHRIKQSVSSLHFEDHSEVSLSRFPQFLTDLSALRSLTIDRFYSDIIGRNTIRGLLRQLTPELKELSLQWVNSHNVVFPETPENPESGLGSTTAWTLKDAFPVLEHLRIQDKEVWTTQDLEALPATLTSLHTLFPNLHEREFAKRLPRGLESLVVNRRVPEQIDPEFWAELPQLTRLAVGYLSDRNTAEHLSVLASLPKSLTDLELFQNNFSPFALLRNLPPRLTAITCSDYPHSTPQVDLRVIFPYLKTFRVQESWTGSAPPHPRDLPQDTTHLETSLSTAGLEPAQWPKSLTVLRARGLENDFNAAVFPPGLVTLNLPDMDMDHIKLLPRTLTSLGVTCSAFKNTVDFPPHLTSLSVGSRRDTPWSMELELLTPILDANGAAETLDWDKPDHIKALLGAKVLNCFSFSKIPATVTSLHLPAVIPASQLKYLPLHLEDFEFADIFEDADFDRTSAVEVSRMRTNFYWGRLSHVRESFNPDDLTEANIATLLPRTLHSIWTRADAMALRVDWKLFPPQLKFAGFRSDATLPAILLDELPMGSLKSISATVDDLRDEHFKRLPRNLPGLDFRDSVITSITPSFARYLPIGSESFLQIDDELWNDVSRLSSAAKKAMHDGNVQLLRKLLSADDDVMDYIPADE